MDVDVLKARLVRQDIHQPWGFILQGGAEIQQPISIATILPVSPAANIGLRVGDIIVEIEHLPTDSITGQQAWDLIETPTATLRMTVERRVYSDDQITELPNNSSDGNFRIHCDHNLMEKQDQSFDFCTVHARPFGIHEEQLSCPFASTPYSCTSHLQINQQLDTFETETATCPQSRTFKVLQSVMHNNESSVGVNGLPPPRSATLEHLKSNRQRIRVLMPQQYNSPMGMYSAHNVLETFSTQAESMLDPFKSLHSSTTGNSSNRQSINNSMFKLNY